MAAALNWTNEFRRAALDHPVLAKIAKIARTADTQTQGESFGDFGDFVPPLSFGKGPPVGAALAPDSVPDEWVMGIWSMMAMLPPDHFPPRSWKQAVADASGFLKAWGPSAYALGWATEQLFGADPLQPLRRTDMMGLCILLDGRTVAAVSDDKIAVKNRRGVLKHFYRQPIQKGAVPLWRLGQR